MVAIEDEPLLALTGRIVGSKLIVRNVEVLRGLLLLKTPGVRVVSESESGAGDHFAGAVGAAGAEEGAARAAGSDSTGGLAVRGAANRNAPSALPVGGAAIEGLAAEGVAARQPAAPFDNGSLPVVCSAPCSLAELLSGVRSPLAAPAMFPYLRLAPDVRVCSLDAFSCTGSVYTLQALLCEGVSALAHVDAASSACGDSRTRISAADTTAAAIAGVAVGSPGGASCAAGTAAASPVTLTAEQRSGVGAGGAWAWISVSPSLISVLVGVPPARLEALLALPKAGGVPEPCPMGKLPPLGAPVLTPAASSVLRAEAKQRVQALEEKLVDHRGGFIIHSTPDGFTLSGLHHCDAITA